MPANVYQLAVPGHDDGFPHLHVVVIAIDATQRLCIPAYGADGQKINELTSALHRDGIYAGVGWIEMDNAKAVKFTGKWTGKLAKWVPYKLSRIEQSRLNAKVGDMSDEALAKIVECLLRLHATRPASTLAEDELKKVKQLARQLDVTIPRGI